MKDYKRNIEELFAQGVVVLDKPAGPKCKYVVNKVQGILEVAHAGHVGTLDPQVVGVLTICLNKATKISGVLSEADKAYEGVMKLHGEISDAKVKAAFKKFTGVIEQLPPKISAVKRVVRKRKIYYFKFLKREENKVWFRVKCQHGTYIRKLAFDVGEYLKVGAHMWRLRRIESGAFTEKDVVSLDDLKKNYKKFLKTKSERFVRKIIRPIEDSVLHIGGVWIDDRVLKPLKNGSPIFVPGITKTTKFDKKEWIAIFDSKNRLCAIGKAAMSSAQIKKVKKGLAVKTDIVLI